MVGELGITTRRALVALLLPLWSACPTYLGITRTDDSKIYLLTGSTSFLFFWHTWVQRCVEKVGALTCVELPVEFKQTPQQQPDTPTKKAAPAGGGDGKPAPTETGAGTDEAPPRREFHDAVPRYAPASRAAKPVAPGIELTGSMRTRIGGRMALLRMCRDVRAKSTTKIAFNLTVNKAGAVAGVEFREIKGDGPFGECLERVLRMVAFEAPPAERRYAVTVDLDRGLVW